MCFSDVVIVGNGVLGMTLARELHRQCNSMSVAIVGPEDRAGSASVAAGAMINVYAEIEPGADDDPAMAAKFDMARRAMGLWDDHARSLSEEGEEVSIVWGTYVLDSRRDLGSDDGAFDQMLRTMTRVGVEHRVLPVRELLFLAADPRFRPSRAVVAPDGHVESRRVLRALEAGLRRSPACKMIGARAIGLEIAAGNDKRILLSDGGELRTPIVVLANGAYAQSLIDQIAELRQSVPRLLFGGGSALEVTIPESVWIPDELEDLRRVVRVGEPDSGCGIHLIPRGHRTYYCGSSSLISLTPEPHPRLHAVSRMLQGLRQEIHHAFFHSMVALRHRGHRPVSLDAYPLLGESDVRGIWFCNGTKRDGFTDSPFIGRELAKAIVNRPSDLPQVFRPSRPLISYRNREHAIEAVVQARLSSDIMHGLSLPTYRWAGWSAQHYDQVNSVYDRRGIEGFGIHPELLHLYDSDGTYSTIRHGRDRP